MLLIQTAFDQEFAAVLAAGSHRQAAEIPGGSLPASDMNLQRLTIAGQPCLAMMTGMGLSAARARLTDLLDRLERLSPPERPELVLSIGLAGGLNPDLPFGYVGLIDNVVKLDQPVNDLANVGETKGQLGPIPANVDRLSSNLRERVGVHSLVSIRQVALTMQSKRRLTEQTGAELCDMETHAVADVCRQRQLPWVGVRVVSDTAREDLPAWVLTLPPLVEQKRWLKVSGRVVTHPQDWPSLLRLALRMQRLKPILTQVTIDLVTHVLSA